MYWKKYKLLSEKALQSMGFYNEQGLLANGALLFADDYGEKKTEVQCSVFSGFNKGSNIDAYYRGEIRKINSQMNCIVHIFIRHQSILHLCCRI